MLEEEKKDIVKPEVDEEEVPENKEPITTFSKFWLWMCIVLLGLIVVLAIIIKLLG
jgi:hypothetical protein